MVFIECTAIVPSDSEFEIITLSFLLELGQEKTWGVTWESTSIIDLEGAFEEPLIALAQIQHVKTLKIPTMMMEEEFH